MKRTAALLLTVILLLFALAAPTFAIDPFDREEELSLKVTFEVDGELCSGVRFHLYQVADMETFGNLVYTKDFKECKAGDLVDLSKEKTQELCEKLYAFIEKRVNLKPVDDALTDKYGEVEFPSGKEELAPGLYLLTSDRFTTNGISHEAQPFLVCLPYRGADELWDYDMEVMPKLADNQVDVKVLWEDKGYEEKRPKSVKIELLQGDEVYDTVTLSEDNDWHHIWEDLPGGYKWSVREVPEPDGYKVYIDRVPGGYRVINTYSPPPGKTLPQTGLLRWPVPVMASLGVFLFVLGWVKNRRKANEEE